MSDQSNLGTENLVDQIVTLKNMLGQFGRLIEISLNLNTTLDQEKILELIIHTAADILACDAVSIMLYDEASEELNFMASTDTDPEQLARIPVPIEDSIAGMIFSLNSPQIINNLSADPRHYHLVSKQLGLKHQSLVGVPMRLHEKVIGVIEGINKKDGEFTEEDIDILSVIASQAAVAINNARMMKSLQAAYQELSQIERLKTDFISIASHELRTPLFHIMGYIELLEMEAEGDAVESIQQVMKSAQLMQSLVDDMTNLNLLETRSQQLDKTQIPIQQVIEDAYQEVHGLYQQREIETRFKLPKEPLTVSVDPEKMHQALTNLLENAARFTPRGGMVEINAKQGRNHIQVTIRDNGIGIPPDRLESIFERMVQAGDHHTRSHGGLGLGLPITRAILSLHGGRIWAESDGKGKGSAFIFTLPLQKVLPFIMEE